MFRMLCLCSAAALAAALAAPAPAQALSMKECGAKYQSAKDANTLKGQSWNDFRKAECAAADDAAAPATPAPAPKPTAATAAPSSGGGGLTMKECSVKYQAAKEANTLKGMKWNDFRKAECTDDDASEADAAAAETAANAPAPKPTSGQKTPPTSTTADAPKKPTVSGKVAFPGDVSSKYADETAGKARMHTCLDQYRANKEAGVDQPKWIEKGGGYYSQCNTKLKAGA